MPKVSLRSSTRKIPAKSAIKCTKNRLTTCSDRYDPEYLGGEHWAKLVADFKDQKTLDRKMVEAFVNKLTLYNDGRAEIEFNFRDELEEVLLWAAMRKKEVNKYAG